MMETTDFLFVDLLKNQKHTPDTDWTEMDGNVPRVSSETSRVPLTSSPGD